MLFQVKKQIAYWSIIIGRKNVKKSIKTEQIIQSAMETHRTSFYFEVGISQMLLSKYVGTKRLKTTTGDIAYYSYLH